MFWTTQVEREKHRMYNLFAEVPRAVLKKVLSTTQQRLTTILEMIDNQGGVEPNSEADSDDDGDEPGTPTRGLKVSQPQQLRAFE